MLEAFYIVDNNGHYIMDQKCPACNEIHKEVYAKLYHYDSIDKTYIAWVCPATNMKIYAKNI